MTLVVKSDKCRLCGRVLKDQSDLWAGRCNNDDACAKRVCARDEVDVEKIVIERDALRETVRTLKARVVDLEQRLIDAECERDASRGMEQAAEQRAERLYRDRERVTAATSDARSPHCPTTRSSPSSWGANTTWAGGSLSTPIRGK